MTKSHSKKSSRKAERKGTTATQRIKLLLYGCLSGDGRSHPCTGWPGHALSLEWTSQGWISETWSCSFLPLSTVSMKTKNSKRTQKPKPKSERIILHYSNYGKNTCPSYAQAVWKNSCLLSYPNSIHTVFSQRKLKLLPKVLQLKSLGMWIWAWEVWLAVLLSLQLQLWAKLIHLFCKNKIGGTTDPISPQK